MLASLPPASALSVMSPHPAVGLAPELIKDKLQVVWYSSQIPVLGRFIGHTEFVWNGEMISPFGGYSIVRGKRDIKRLEKSAEAGRGKGFVKFHIGVTLDEAAKIDSFLAENQGKLAPQVCVSGMSRILNMTADAKIPFALQWLPGLNALYLSVQHLAGNPRVHKIESFGNASISDLLVSVPVEIGVTASVLTAGVFATATGTTLLAAGAYLLSVGGLVS